VGKTPVEEDGGLVATTSRLAGGTEVVVVAANGVIEAKEIETPIHKNERSPSTMTARVRVASHFHRERRILIYGSNLQVSMS